MTMVDFKPPPTHASKPGKDAKAAGPAAITAIGPVTAAATSKKAKRKRSSKKESDDVSLPAVLPPAAQPAILARLEDESAKDTEERDLEEAVFGIHSATRASTVFSRLGRELKPSKAAQMAALNDAHATPANTLLAIGDDADGESNDEAPVEADDYDFDFDMDVDGALPASGADDDDDDDAPGFYLDEGTVTAAEQPAALEDSDADEASKANQLAARLLSSAKTDDSEADEPLDESLVDTGASTLADPVINKEADAAWHDDDVLKVSLNRQNRTKKLRTSYADDMLSIQEYELRLRRQFHTMSAAKMGSTQGLGWANVDKRAAGKLGDATSNPPSATEDGVVMASGRINPIMAMLSSSKLLLSGNKKASTGLADLERVSIPSDRVDIQRLRDATISSPHNSIITSVKFHPNPQVPIMMTSGLDKTVKLFHIDAKDNPKLSSYRFKDLAPTCTSFAQQGKTAFITGEHRFFYTFNVETETMDICNQLSSSNYDYMFNNSKGIARHWANPSGSHVAMSANNLNGHLMFVSCRDRTLDYTLKMNGKASQVWFEQDGYTLWSAGHDAFMYQWDLRQRRCVGQWMDEGQQRSMSMAGSNDGRYLAVGSRSGVVNLYNRPALAASALAASDQAGKPKPVKTFMQLTTRLDSLCVHPGSQIMAMASRSRLDSLRLVHLPTQTVFSNWPTGSTPLHYVQCLDFSPNGGYLGVGNDRGRVLLFRLNAYTRSI